MEILLIMISLSLIFFGLYISNQKRKGIVKFIQFKHINGIDELAKGIDVGVSFEDKVIKIDDIKIPISSIYKLEVSSSKQLVDKDKSVINRAIVGSMIGGVGAIVGGLSGINDGIKTTKLMYYLTITFKDNNIAIFSFNRDGDRFDVENVIKRLK